MMERVGVVGGVGDRVDSGDGEGGIAVGEDGVAEGRDAASERVGVERVPETSIWLSKKLPSNIPTLMIVIANPPISCPRPAGFPSPVSGFPLTSFLILLESGTSQRWGILASHDLPLAIAAG